MTPNLPTGVDRQKIAAALPELRAWRRHAIRAAAQTENDSYATRNRQLVEDLEMACYYLERLLHPANGRTA